MERLIKMSKKNHACFLCKHAANDATLSSMEENFNVQGERAGVEGKQATMIKQLEGSLEQLITNGCQKHSLQSAIELVESE